MSKERSDSKLKHLPEERQDQIIEWCNTPNQRGEDGKPIKETGGLPYARAQLAADGLKVSERALSDFYSWWHLQRNFRDADNLTTQLEEMLKQQFPDVNPEKITEMGQLIFTLQATQARDAKEFREMEYLRLAKETGATKARQKDTELKLAERRV